MNKIFSLLAISITFPLITMDGAEIPQQWISITLRDLTNEIISLNQSQEGKVCIYSRAI